MPRACSLRLTRVHGPSMALAMAMASQRAGAYQRHPDAALPSSPLFPCERFPGTRSNGEAKILPSKQLFISNAALPSRV